MLVYFWLNPQLLLRVEYVNIIHNPLLVVPLSSPKDYEVLGEVGGGVTVARGRRVALDLLN